MDLYDRAEDVITQAGLVNEGKVHLGFVYANDPSLRTAARLMSGALLFRRSLRRWIDLDSRPLEMSPPVHYLVPRESSLPVRDIEAYFHRIEALHGELSRSLQSTYLDTPAGPFFAPLPSSSIEQHYNAERILAAYSTIERSVDPIPLAERLRAAVRAVPEIRLRTGCTVRRVTARASGGLDVEFESAGDTHGESYRAVVNALWSGRLGIDAGLGLAPRRPWIYRYKFGIRLTLAAGRSRLPTVTLVHGAFGDVVDFPGERGYLSWYPAGMVGTSQAITPPNWNASVGDARRRQICDDSIRALGDFCIALRDLPEAAIESVNVQGGVIFAWGATDIDDAASELHQRFDIGIVSAGNYHSVDPGKYTMAPAFAIEVCDRIEGTR